MRLGARKVRYFCTHPSSEYSGEGACGIKATSTQSKFRRAWFSNLVVLHQYMRQHADFAGFPHEIVSSL